MAATQSLCGFTGRSGRPLLPDLNKRAALLSLCGSPLPVGSSARRGWQLHRGLPSPNGSMCVSCDKAKPPEHPTSIADRLWRVRCHQRNASCTSEHCRRAHEMQSTSSSYLCTTENVLNVVSRWGSSNAGVPKTTFWSAFVADNQSMGASTQGNR